MKSLTLVITTTFVLIFTSVSVAAQEEKSQDIPKDLERIEVINKVPIYRLEANALKAKMDFYDMFNKINEVRDYHIICKRVAQPGSNIKRQQCEPYYFKEKRSELGRSLSNGDISRTLSLSVSEQEVAVATKETKAEADAYTIKLIQENPELMERYKAFAAANKAYRQRQAEEK